MTTYVGNPPKSVYGVQDATNIVFDHVTDGTETQIDITGLDFANDHEYVIDISSNYPTASVLTLLDPADLTRANYLTMYSIVTNGGTPTGGADNDSYLSQGQTGNILLTQGTISWNETAVGNNSGYLTWQTFNFYYQSSANKSVQYSGYHNTPTAPPTTLRIVENAAGLIDAGMHIRITKREATNLVLPLEYSAPRKNILINSDFAINQRGYVSGAAAASGEYTYDRWMCDGANGTFTLNGQKVTLDNTTASTYGYMAQYIEQGQLTEGEWYTLSWEGDAEVSLYYANGSTLNYKSSPITFQATAGAGNIAEWVEVRGDGQWIQKLKLEEGRSATPWEKPDKSLELVRCMRYYQRLLLWTYDFKTAFNDGSAAVMTTERLHIEMRDKPTYDKMLTGTGVAHIRRLQDNAVMSSTATIVGLNWNAEYDRAGVYFQGGLSGLSNQGYGVQMQSNTVVGITAEL